MNFKNYTKNIFIFNQPITFYIIFFIELLERFGYYGLQSILITYLIKNLNISEHNVINIFSSFNAILYGFISIGGWASDKIIGRKRSIILGLIMFIIGYLIITISKDIYTVYLGMSFISVGNGLFKTNPSFLITNIYKDNISDLDSAFTMYYMSINIGSFISIIMIPLIALKYNYNIAFLIPLISLFITLISFIYFYKHFDKFGSEVDFKNISIKKYLYILISTFIFIIFSFFLIKNFNLSKFMLMFITFFMLIKLFKEIYMSYGKEKSLLIISCIMIFKSMLFFILYGQMPTSLNFFTINHVRNKMFGINFTSEQFQALNPLWIIILSPILTYYYSKNNDKNFKIMYKFVFGMILCSLSFFVLSLGSNFHDNFGNISSYWLLLSYFLQSLGELLISGLGLSMIAKFIPSRLMGFMIGFWFLTNSLSIILSGYLANIISNNVCILNKIESLYNYGNFFYKIGLFSIFVSIIMIFITYKLEDFFKI